ncbi:glycosyltransferase [Jiangella endophytica]|uniref:glycosyltransferase n=1 Tax=Jiangella endophytica TaxID=1623398 RepID=UPI000E34C516|nr:glycosyltransferase [Jiangella endophytica]
MTTLHTSPAPVAPAVPAAGPPVLDLVIPVHNEAATLDEAVRRTHDHVRRRLPFTARITIADNASTDDTLAVAHRVAAELDGVRVLHLDRKGRGRALREAWSTSDAAVLAYMDVDLSTDLSALLPLVAPLVSGHSEVAVGTRLARGARVVRGPKRELISRGYNLLLHGVLAARFSDAQCGFKAIRADAATQLLPLVADGAWFFDTELLVLAERAGLRIHEVPVDWVDDPDSRVDIVATAVADLRGVARLGRDLVTGRVPLDRVRAALPAPLLDRNGALPPSAAGARAPLAAQVQRFAVVGVVCTVLYAVLFLAARPSLGAQAANLAALLVATLVNTALNRRLTFGVRGRSGLARHHGQGLVVFGLCWALTAGALALLELGGAAVSHTAELAAVTVANLMATALRFVLLRGWVFR